MEQDLLGTDTRRLLRDPLCPLARDIFSRLAGTPPIPGNRVRLLKDGAENYAAWLEAIASARRVIHFENYILRDDAVGRRFAAALIERARSGITVRLLHDWFGCLGTAPARFWRELQEAGIEVRTFNPLRFDSPFGWLSRNHRKMLSVDGRVGFVSGLCVGSEWIGDPARERAPWRDTGIRLDGPAVGELDRAFAQSWTAAGGELPAAPLAPPAAGQAHGPVAVRLIDGQPGEAALYRLDLLLATVAHRSLWLTDAYFIGTPAYLQALAAAARDGVDVRLLVPGTSDLALIRALSRIGYRPLLEAGVRIFEWNGPMLHAKTAVVDGRWSRIGSTNLNLAGWIGNWELDLLVEDDGVADSLEAMFEQDLGYATEVVLNWNRVRPLRIGSRATPRRRDLRPARLVAGAVGLGRLAGAAAANRRPFGSAEAGILAAGGAALLTVATIALFVPWLIVVPVAAAGAWGGLALLARAWAFRRSAHNTRDA